MKIKGQTRKLAAGCSKQSFEVTDRKVSSKHCFEAHGKATMTWFEVVDETDEVSSKHCFEAHGKATMTWFEVI
ncbi:hypothetical protein [Streptococcus pneumoniae]|uniref:hypothetical protein n=1 Tax=Streptococcus pneumoniae TaxID=1313 RepID=UPI000B590DE6|nr:hypothetical protein [Streptococcus pneumoniae]